MKPASSLLPILLATLALAGCAVEGPFPSLAPRAIEGQPLGEPERPVPLVADDPALRSTVNGLVGRARQSDREFEGALASAESAARSAGGVGSDSWIAAQEQISRTEAARAGTTRALADLDRLALDRSNLPTSTADQAALRSAIAEVQLLASEQQVRLDRLKAIIAR